MKRLRTFIALDLGKSVRDKAVALQESLARGGGEVKWVEPENLHVTLLFLGEVDDRDVPAVCRAVGDCCQEHAPFLMSVAKVGCFPNLRRPRVVWIGVDQGAQEVVALHDALEETLLELGCYRREDRQYTPHITLGRVKREDGSADALAALLAKKAGWQAGEVSVREVLVMSSELTSQGPVYSVLSRARLGSA
jgi:RNA 2',3'-cyclic 3'-phosphodiesterase